jgi:hypothetical protein
MGQKKPTMDAIHQYQADGSSVDGGGADWADAGSAWEEEEEEEGTDVRSQAGSSVASEDVFLG